MPRKLETQSSNPTKYANHVGWSDINPFEVIKENTARKLTIRSMTSESKNTDKLEFHVGGFSAHCSNQHDQEWTITSNPDGTIYEIRLNKKGEWHDKHGHKYRLADAPVKFHDYNF